MLESHRLRTCAEIDRAIRHANATMRIYSKCPLRAARRMSFFRRDQVETNYTDWMHRLQMPLPPRC